MYSKIQQQCLNELGIIGYELKPEFIAVGSLSVVDKINTDEPDLTKENALSWQQIPKTFADDLAIIFKDIQYSTSCANMVLKDKMDESEHSFQWKQLANIDAITLEQSNLCTPDITTLSAQQKREIWQLLQTLIQ